MSNISNTINQSFFLPKPTFIEKNLPDQSGRVVIVTGGYAGVGYQLTRLLYQRNATVHVAGRSKEKGDKAISSIRAEFPQSTGRLEFLQLDLADLASIKASARDFMGKEQRLDVLVNNAGVMHPPKSLAKHGFDHEYTTNVLGPFLFTTQLMPLLKKTAATAPKDSVRVAWAASLAVDGYTPKGGITFDEKGQVKVLNKDKADYGQTKTANVFLAEETARRFGKDGILSVSFNPGNLQSELQRHWPALQRKFATSFILHPTIFGGYTELYAGWSPDITESRNGAYVIPWGRIGSYRKDIREAAATGAAKKLWEWCEKETGPFA